MKPQKFSYSGNNFKLLFFLQFNPHMKSKL